MPYKDADQRKAAARKWRLQHRAQRAAYMRRYRRSRSSGRSRGRPRIKGRDFESPTRAPEVPTPPFGSASTVDLSTGTHTSSEEVNPPASDADRWTDPAGGRPPDSRGEQLPPGTEAALPYPSDSSSL